MINWITCAEDKDTLTLCFRTVCSHVITLGITWIIRPLHFVTLRFRALQNEWPPPFFIYPSIPVPLAVARSTHSVISRSILLESMTVFSAEDGLFFVIESTGLLLPWIHFTSVISRLSYDCLRAITFTINRFSTVVPRRTRQSYRDLLSVAKINGMGVLSPSILIRVALSTEPISNPWTIAKSSAAKTLRVTRLHFTDDQCKIFAALVESARQMT